MKLIALLAVALAALAAPALGADPAHAPAETRTGEELRIANRPIITLYGPISGYSAHDRVDTGRKRIHDVLDNAAHPVVTTTAVPDGTLVSIAGSPAFLVMGIDVHPEVGETTQNVAREAAARLDLAIADYREQRTPQFVVDATLRVTLATLIFLLALHALQRLNRAAGRWLAEVAARHSKRVHLEGVALLDEARMAGAARRIVALLTWALGLLAAYLWVTYTFEQIPYTRHWGDQMEENIAALLEEIAISAVHAVPGLAMVVLIVVGVRALIGVSRVFFARIERGENAIGALDTDTAMPTRRLVELGLWLFALALAFPFLPGSHTYAFKGVSVLAGLAASIAASSVLAQAASGLTLLYGRVIRRGEYIRVDEFEGKVSAIGIFNTRLRTPRGEEVMVPNSRMNSLGVRNFSRARPGYFVAAATISVGYATHGRDVKAMLLEAARRIPIIEQDPPPRTRQFAYADFAIRYELVTFTRVDHQVERADVLDRLNEAIQDVFAERGVQIMAPHYHVDPAQPQVPPVASAG